MRPKKHRTTGSNDLFRARLDQIINMKHELVQLAGKIDWDWIDGEVAPLFSENGPPGIETRFMIGLLLRPGYPQHTPQDRGPPVTGGGIRPSRLAGPRRSARNSSASVAGNSISSMPGRWSASAKARLARLTSSASRPQPSSTTAGLPPGGLFVN